MSDPFFIVFVVLVTLVILGAIASVTVPHSGNMYIRRKATSPRLIPAPVETTVVTTTTTSPKYLSKKDHMKIHKKKSIDDELRQIAKSLLSNENMAVKSRIAPRPAVVRRDPTTSKPAKLHGRKSNKWHVKGCGCNTCRFKKRVTPAPVCASVQLPLGRINYTDFDAWKGRLGRPRWARPATRRPVDRPSYTAVPINYKMRPGRSCGY